MKRLLVTGSRGFVGTHLLKELDKSSVWVPVLPASDWDLRDITSVRSAISGLKIDAVIHLAAQSSVPRAFENPTATFETNAVGTLNLLSALKSEEFTGRFLYVSSADVYGVVPNQCLPANEDTLPAPRNPYAASKFSAEIVCQQWSRSENFQIVIARPFNHIGPGQAEAFAVPAIAKQLADIVRFGTDPILRVGDIDVTRDFTDVRDIVRAYISLITGPHINDLYVVGSGQERTIRSIIESLCSIAGVKADIIIDENLLRRSEQRRMMCDATRIKNDHGWSPCVNFETTLTDIFTDKMETVK